MQVGLFWIYVYGFAYEFFSELGAHTPIYSISVSSIVLGNIITPQEQWSFSNANLHIVHF